MFRTPASVTLSIGPHASANARTAHEVKCISPLLHSALVLVWSAGAALADPFDRVLPPDSTVAGHDLAWYAMDWWQWAFSMPTDQSPVRDTGGHLCGVNQRGPVWYLAGGFGSAQIHRECIVPPEKFIFFPIITTMVTTMPEQTQTCEEVRAQTAENNDRYVYLAVELDGIPVPDLLQTRIAPKACFDLARRAPPALEKRSFFPTATDGFWLMLPPLSAGEHHLSFRAFYTNDGAAWGDAIQNITYDLQVQSAD